MMGSPGLNFNPNEEQLVFHYLKNKNSGIKEKPKLIREVDVFKLEPWDLPERCYLPMCDNQWHFFSPVDWKYPSGSLAKRPTKAGYWRITRRFKTVHSQSSLTGVGKTLRFYKGKHPFGEKTEWIMNEFHLDEIESETRASLQHTFVLCHLKKNELTAKSGGMQAPCDEDNSEDKLKLDLMPNPNNTDLPQVPATGGSESSDCYLTRQSSDELIDELLRECQRSEEMKAIFNGDFIELKDFENSESSMSSGNVLNNGGNVLNNGGPAIQLRPRRPALDSSHQDVSSEGTSRRRVRLQLHKMDASAGPTETCVTSTDIHYTSGHMDEDKGGSMCDPPLEQLLSDSCGGHKHNLESENFATGNEVTNRMDESSWCQNREAIDPANFSSVFNSADIPFSHSLSPTFLQASPVLNVEPSETIEMLPDTFGTGVTIHVSITAKISKSNMKEQTCFKGCVEESDELSVAEHLHESANSVSENPKALLSQAASSDEDSTFGGSLPNSGTLSSVHLEESSALNSSEGNSPTLPKEGSKSSSILIKILSSIHGSPASAMELPPDWKSDKQILGLENTTNSGSLSHPVISDPVTTLTLRKVPSKGILEYPKLDTASSGLRARPVQRSNIVGGGKDKRREACEHSAGPSYSSVQPRAPSGLFSQLSKRVSLTGSRGRVVLTSLFGTAFLVFLLFLLSSILGIFASTYSAIAF